MADETTDIKIYTPKQSPYTKKTDPYGKYIPVKGLLQENGAYLKTEAGGIIALDLKI